MRNLKQLAERLLKEKDAAATPKTKSSVRLSGSASSRSSSSLTKGVTASVTLKKMTRIDFSITFTIRELPKSLNQVMRSKSVFQLRNHSARWKKMVDYATSGRRPKVPYERCRLILTRHSSVPMDFDGIVGSFKPIVDGLVECGFMVDDTLEVTGQWICRHKKAKQKEGMIEVTFQGLSQSL